MILIKYQFSSTFIPISSYFLNKMVFLKCKWVLIIYNILFKFFWDQNFDKNLDKSYDN